MCLPIARQCMLSVSQFSQALSHKDIKHLGYSGAGISLLTETLKILFKFTTIFIWKLKT